MYSDCLRDSAETWLGHKRPQQKWRTTTSRRKKNFLANTTACDPPVRATDPLRRLRQAEKSKIRSLEFADAAVASQFDLLCANWKDQTSFLSSETDIVLNPNYQRIIGMGKGALPFILKDLAENGGAWFWALRSITGEDPVPHGDEGNTKLMKKAWLAWGLVNL